MLSLILQGVLACMADMNPTHPCVEMHVVLLMVSPGLEKLFMVMDTKLGR